MLNIGGPRYKLTEPPMGEAHVEDTTTASRSTVGMAVRGLANSCDDTRPAVVAIGRKDIVDFEFCERALSR